MKKRILSLMLVFLVVMGSVSTGLVSAAQTVVTALSDGDKGTSSDPYIISDYTSFKTYLLKNESYSNKTYFKFTSDISVPSDEELTGNYILNNAEIDGAGHTVSGINLTNAPLFKSVSDSAVRMLNFRDSSVVYTDTTVVNCSFFAAEIGKNCFITSCRFDGISITADNMPKANVGIIAASNSGYITNCVAKSATLSFSADSAVVGTLVAVNNSGGFIVNSIAEPSYDITKESEPFTLGGIAGKNSGSVKYCYSDAYPYDNTRAEIRPVGTSTGTCEYNLYCGKSATAFDSGNVEKSGYMENSNTLAALMTEGVIANYNSSLSSRFNTADFACPWTQTNGELDLSFDGREAIVTLRLKAELKGAKLTFSDTDSLAASYFSQYDEYVVKVGKYSDTGGYTQNEVTIEYSVSTPATMVKNFVISAKHNCVYRLNNVMTGTGTYSVQYIPASQDGKVNKATVGLYPYPAVLSLTSVTEGDEIVPYDFQGSGTKEDPFLIRNEYELRTLSSHVSNCVTYGENKKQYNRAHYLLKSDINLTQEFNPIGVKASAEDTAFSGVFDGGCHTIRGLKISAGKPQSGLFGLVRGERKGLSQSYAQIKDLIIEDASIQGATGTENAIKGVLVGQAEYTIISGCFTTGNVSGDTQIAGVVGYAYECDVSNCGSYANVNTYSATAWAGGVVGHAQHSEVKNCYYAGNLTPYNIVEEGFLNIGGVSGYITNSTFDNCYYTPDTNINWATDVKGITQVSESDATGGALLKKLITYNDEKGISVYWTSGGKSYPVITTPDNVSHNVYFAKNANGMGRFKDGMSNPFAPGATVSVNLGISWYKIAITDLNNNQLDIPYTCYNNYEFVFTMPAQSVKVHPVYNTISFEGMGTKEEPYLIYNLRELKLAIEKSNGYSSYETSCYKLCADIDCGGETLDSLYKKYTFKGEFDGNGHTISNVAFSGSFIENMSGKLKNLTLENVSSQGEGFLLGNVSGDSVVTNMTVKNCNAQGFVIARDIKAKLSVYNSVIDSVKTSADKLSVYYKTCTGSMDVNNLVILDTSAEAVCFASDNHSGNVTASNVYYGSNQAFTAGNFSCKAVSPSEYKSVDFILGLSDVAKNELSSQGAYMWGASSTTGNPELATDGTVPTPYKITYTSAIDISNMLDIDKIPSAAFANNTIEIYYNPAYSISGLIIEANGRRLNYITSDSDVENRNVLRFIMPEGDVKISYDGTTPAIYHLLGHGTESDPYIISHRDEFLHFADVINQEITVEHPSDGTEYVDYFDAYVVITKDIDLGKRNWMPMGNYGTEVSFLGILDGQGFEISGELTVDIDSVSPSDSYLNNNVGLFGYVENATVKNLVLDYSLIMKTGSEEINAVGALAGYCKNAYFENIYSKCNVSYSSTAVRIRELGGIAGFVNRGEGRFTRCIADNTYGTMMVYRFGGIVSKHSSDASLYLDYCANLSDISFTGSVSRVSGLVGETSYGLDLTIKNSYNFGQIGECSGDIAYHSSSGTDASKHYENNYSLNGVGWQTHATHMSAEDFASGKVAYLLNSGVTDGTQVWYQNIDNDLGVDAYPLFTGGTVYERLDKSYSNYLFIPAVYNSTTGYYEVENASQLYWISAVVNGDHTYAKFDKTPVTMKVKLLGDIDLSVMNMPFTPIGNTEEKFFSGVFDGQGHTISSITLCAGEYTGLFGVNSGIICNLSLTGIISLVADTPVQVNSFGAVTGKIKGGQITDVYSNLTYDLSNIKSVKYLGSLAGYTGTSAVDFFRCIAYNTYHSTETEVDYYGGIVGYVERSCRVQHCGNISSFNLLTSVAAGGLVGGTQCDNMIIVDSYTVGETKGATGAIIGVCNMDDIIAYNNYYPDIYATGSEYDKAGIAMKPYDFVSGKVAYLMNYGVTNGTQVWYQTILTDYVPVPTNTSKTVYKTGDNAYSNTPEGGGMISGGKPILPNKPTAPDSETGKDEADKDIVNTGSAYNVFFAIVFVVLWLFAALILECQRRKEKVILYKK